MPEWVFALILYVVGMCFMLAITRLERLYSEADAKTQVVFILGWPALFMFVILWSFGFFDEEDESEFD